MRKEAEGVAADGSKRLAKKIKWHKHGMPAIVLDVDDTSLATWNYEIFSNWAYNPVTNATYVTGQLFPAVPGMVAMATQAAAEGYAVFYLTGRPAVQEPATLGNLTADGIGVDAGFPAPTPLANGEDGLFTKPAVADYPAYLTAACSGDPNGSCTTVHYKSATRAHIESLGYDIVANFGDQFSDLAGRLRGLDVQAPEPELLPAVVRRRRESGRALDSGRVLRTGLPAAHSEHRRRGDLARGHRPRIRRRDALRSVLGDA